MAAKGKRFCWTEAGQPVEESISTAMARQGSVKIVWILSLGLICSSFFCFQEFPFKYFLSMMLDNLFEIQVIEQKFMLNVKVALCDVVLKMSFSRSTVAFPILLGLASARPYSFFFQALHLCQHICSYHPRACLTWGKSCGFCKVQVAEQAGVATTCWTLCLSESEKNTLEAASSYRSCSAYCQAQGGGCISVVSESMAMAIHGDPVIRWPSMCKSL